MVALLISTIWLALASDVPDTIWIQPSTTDLWEIYNIALTRMHEADQIGKTVQALDEARAIIRQQAAQITDLTHQLAAPVQSREAEIRALRSRVFSLCVSGPAVRARNDCGDQDFDHDGDVDADDFGVMQRGQ